MNNDEAKTLLKSLSSYAKFHGLSKELVDDYSQYSIEKILNGRKATFQQLFYDFLCDNFGHPTKSKLKHLSQNINAYDDGVRYEEPEEKKEFNYKSIRINRKHKPIFLLHYKWGFKVCELSELFGVSQSRISQIITRLTKSLIKKAKAK